MKIGIMGGTFDPIHNGHLALGHTAYEQFDLDEVWFMPNGNPPHKEQSSIKMDADTRSHMVEIAIAGTKEFRLEKYEVTREGVCCSYETMEYFKSQYPEDEFYFIIGADSLFAIETWVHPELLFPNCIILAAFRDEINTAKEMNLQIRYLEEKYNARIKLLNAPMVHISSSELRKRLMNGRPVSGWMPEAVEAYIEREQLYGSKNQ